LSRENPEARLEEIELFQGLSKRHLKRLVGESREVRHSAGHHVAEEGLGSLAFHLILEGDAEVRHGDEPLRTLGVGDYFGEISIIDGKPRSATVAAGDDGLTTFAIPYQSFQKLLDDEPGFARTLLTTLCSRLREAEARSS
jgi:CRP-like cAMP-binding protein